MKNIDPYNNAPPPRPGSKCAGGSCGAKPPRQQAPQLPQYSGPPANNYGLDPQTEIRMLRSDLQEAISYIQRLGGTWPPS